MPRTRRRPPRRHMPPVVSRALRRPDPVAERAPCPSILFGTVVRLRLLDLEATGRSARARRICERVGARFCEFLESQGTRAAGAPVPLSALTAEAARRWLIWLRTEHTSVNALTGTPMPKGSRAIQAHAVELKSLARFAVREGLLPADPLASFRTPKAEQKVVEAFTPDQLQRLLRAVDRSPMVARNRAIVFTLLATGMRASELCGLTVADLDLHERRARVLGKGAKWRWVGFDPLTAKLLSRYLAERGASQDGAHTSGPLFLSRYHAPMNRNSLGQLVGRLGAAAGLTTEVRCSPHTFRHTAACAFLAAHPGALFHLQAMLGHTDLTMTRRYARLLEGAAPPPGPSVIEMLGLDQNRPPARRGG